ncbi:MAG TPA: hypothetical protein VF376_05020 [Thermoanaerobaculia bacterium]
MSSRRSGRSALFGLAAVSASILCAQIVLSRLFAATLGYYFAFMLISLAMLGLASGALIVQQKPDILAPERVDKKAAELAIAAGVAIYAGTLMAIQVYPYAKTARYLGLSLVFCCFFPFFLFSGMAVTLVLCRARERFYRAYAVDLVGAAAGSLLAVLLLGWTSPVTVVLRVVAALSLLAAFLFALEIGDRRLCARAAGVLGILLAGSWVLLRSPRVESPPSLGWLERPRVFVGWNSFSNVTVFPSSFFTWSLSEKYAGSEFPMRSLVIDGIGGTQIAQFDGRPGSLRDYSYLDYDLTSLGQRLVPPTGRQLVIGPGGGVDLLQAVRQGRSDVTAVEINPLVAEVVNERLGAYSGRPYRLPGVRVFLENGRTFIKRSTETWDLISLTWVDTGGSATALAASENYLYTIEAYVEFLRHLSPGGYIAFVRGLGELPLDTLRGVSVAVEALSRTGVSRPQDHIVIATARSSFFFHIRMCYVLMKPTPFTTAELKEVRDFLSRLGFQPLWLPGGEPFSVPEDQIQFSRTIREILTAPNRDEVYRQAAWDISPTTDDSPFYFAERRGPHRPAGEGIRTLQACSVLLGVLTLLFIGLPLFPLIRRTERVGFSGAAFLAYCALLGAAFMLVEIELFHFHALVLGNPGYALATVLVSLLIFSGAGSLFASRLSRSSPLLILGVFLALLLLLAGLIWKREDLQTFLVVQSFPARVAGTVALIAPLAFCMGLPMAAGMTLMARRPDLMIWGWALNGAFSVLASVAAVLLAMHIGIARTFCLGLIGYLLAACLIPVVRLGRSHPLPES